MSAGRPLSPSPSASSGLSDFDRLWESSLSQPVSRARPAQSSSSAPAPTAPALDLRRQTKRRRLLSPARSDTTAGSERSEAKEKSGAGGGSGEGDEEGSARDGEKGDDELDGLDFSDSLSLTSYTPPLAAGLALLDGLALADDGVLDDGPAGGSTDDGPLDSSGTDGEDGVSEADGWDFSLPSAAAAQEPDGLPLGESQSASLEPTTRAERQARATAHVEDLLLDALRQLSAHVRQRLGKDGSGSDIDDDDDDKPGQPSIKKLMLMYGGPERRFVWPQKRGAGGNSKALARIWKVLALIHKGLADGATSTKRELYYADPALFGSQATVDRIIVGIVNASGLRRGDFNVTASPKGLFASSAIEIQLVNDEGRVISDGKATVIPSREKIAAIVCRGQTPTDETDSDDAQAEDDEPELILVIEKDATFQALCERRWGRGSVVLITGKGYPDLSTRQFLALLARRFEHTPIYGLLDGDPDGIEILSCYTFGSRSQANSAEERHLLVERMQWLGVRPSEWGRLEIDWDQMLPLTERDHKKIRSMLARPPDRMPPDWKKELCHMQHLRRKAEIQLLQSSPAVPPSEPGAPSSLFDAPEHAGGPAAPALGGVDRLVAYLNAKTGLVGEVDDEEGGAAAGGGWDGDGWFDNDG